MTDDYQKKNPEHDTKFRNVQLVANANVCGLNLKNQHGFFIMSTIFICTTEISLLVQYDSNHVQTDRLKCPYPISYTPNIKQFRMM